MGPGVRGGSVGASVCPWPEAPCDECDGCPLGSGASGSGEWDLVLEVGFIKHTFFGLNNWRERVARDRSPFEV